MMSPGTYIKQLLVLVTFSLYTVDKVAETSCAIDYFLLCWSSKVSAKQCCAKEISLGGGNIY